MFEICFDKEEKNPAGENILLPGFYSMGVESAKDLSLTAFVKGFLSGLEEMKHVEGGSEEETIEGQWRWFLDSEEKILDLGKIFLAVSQIPIHDEVRMELLRFFQNIESWFSILSRVLIQLEEI